MDGVFQPPQIEWFRLAPLLALLAGTLSALLLGSLVPRGSRRRSSMFAVLSGGVAAVFAVVNWQAAADEAPRTIVGGALALDRLAALGTFVVAMVVIATSLVLDGHLRTEDVDGPEMHALLLTTAIGAVVMAAADDFLVLFLGLETLSLSLYLMAASNRKRPESQEAGLKYFILGGFSSAFFLYGVALVYGTTGETSIGGIGARLRSETFATTSPSLLLVGVGLLLVGIGFKVSAVPFQSWTPDVYQGAPSPVTGLMASVGKFAAFVALIRVLHVAVISRVDDWRPVVWVLAILSLVVGSVLAVAQTNVKRMLAFSSVSHVGFVLVGIEASAHADGGDALSAVVLYLVAYSAMVIGSFAIVTLVGDARSGGSEIDDFAGLGRRRPVVAACLTIFLLAQAGMPATSGFIAKFGVIRSAVEAESYAAAVVAMVAAVVAAYLYLRIMMAVWNGDSTDDAAIHVPRATVTVVVVSAVFTLVVGVQPGWLIDLIASISEFAGQSVIS